jgi:tetratricopeptide (TPR) repeat protein
MPVVTPRPLTAAPTSARREPTGAIPTRRDKPAGASSESIDAAIEAAEIARAGDDLLGALEVLRAADGTFPNEPKLQAQLALTMVLVDERKHAKEANRLAHDARRAAPSLPIPYVVMGILLEQIHQKDQAAQMYRHALARDPDCIEATRRMALLEGVKATK